MESFILMEMNSFLCSCSVKISIVLVRTGRACRKPSQLLFLLLFFFVFCFLFFFQVFFVFVISGTLSLAKLLFPVLNHVPFEKSNCCFRIISFMN